MTDFLASGPIGPVTDPAAARALIAAVDARAVAVATPCPGGAMRWRRWGSGAPLVLVHGGGGSWQHWIRNIGPLSRRFEVWCPDLAGFGDSSDPPAPRGVDEVAAVLAEGLDRLFGPDRRVDVAGFSFGGVVSALAARQRPGRIDRLVIVGSTALGLREGLSPLLSWRRAPDAAQRVAAHRANLGILMLAHPRDEDALAITIHAGNVERARFDGRSTAMSTILRDALPDVDAQVRGIWGRLDATAPRDFGRVEATLRSVAPSLRFEAIEDAGHWVQYEAPEAFERALLRMLAR